LLLEHLFLIEVLLLLLLSTLLHCQLRRSIPPCTACPPLICFIKALLQGQKPKRNGNRCHTTSPIRLPIVLLLLLLLLLPHLLHLLLHLLHLLLQKVFPARPFPLANTSEPSPNHQHTAL
jgi:hypothetical protein